MQFLSELFTQNTESHFGEAPELEVERLLGPAVAVVFFFVVFRRFSFVCFEFTAATVFTTKCLRAFELFRLLQKVRGLSAVWW